MVNILIIVIKISDGLIDEVEPDFSVKFIINLIIEPLLIFRKDIQLTYSIQKLSSPFKIVLLIYMLRKACIDMDQLTQHFLEHVVRPTSEPSVLEIKHAITAISNQYPHIDPFLIVQSLYQKLQEMKQQSQIQLSMQQENLPRQIPAKYFDFHNFLKKMIAKSFYLCGYSYEKFLHFMMKKHLSFHIDKRKYIIFSQGMVLQIYRNIQRMMIRNGHRIKLKHKDTIKQLNQVILNDKIYLKGLGSDLLRRFIAKKYEIDDSTFTSNDAYHLYNILEQRYDPFSGQEIGQMQQCLKDIELYSNESSQIILDQLITGNASQVFPQQSIKPSFSNSNVVNQFTQNELHYQTYDLNELNFDMESHENFNI